MSESFRPTPFLLGICSGVRTTLGPAALAVGGPAKVRTVAIAALAAEVIGDKLPGVPSRTSTAPLIGRLITGATVGLLAGRRIDPVLGTGGRIEPVLGTGGGIEPVPGSAATAAALSGFVGAGLATFAGPRWRAVAARRFGFDLPGALIEDVLGCAIALGCLLLLRRAQALNPRLALGARLAPVTILPVGPAGSPESRRTQLR